MFWHLQSSFSLILKFTPFLPEVAHVVECEEIEVKIKTAPPTHPPSLEHECDFNYNLK